MGKKSVERNARLEALRREQRRKERIRALIIYGSAGFVALALLLGIIIYMVVDNRGKEAAREVGYVAASSKAAVAAGCTGVRNDEFRSREHVPATETVRYDVVPPSSGNHYDDPLPDAFRFYEPTSGAPAERAVHSLEHGFVIGWYDPDLPDKDVDTLRTVAEGAGDRFIAVPWTRGSFPEGRHFVLTAWDRTQRCTSVSEEVVREFVTAYANPDPAGAAWDSPTAPESGAGGGTLNITPQGPLSPDAGAQAPPGAGTMGGDTGGTDGTAPGEPGDAPESAEEPAESAPPGAETAPPTTAP